MIQSLGVLASPQQLSEPARAAYDELAFAYDVFTAEFAHERWLAELERLAREHGLAGTTVLDVACGTGKSFLPLLARGYTVTACDISAAMLEVAARKVSGVELFRADMRRLPPVGRFDLVTCLDDALNYLQTEQDVIDALRGFRRSLAPRGLAVWDVSTLAMYRGDWASQWAVERDDVLVLWRGRADAEFAAGERAVATVDVFSLAGGECWRRRRSEHVQRHWPVEAIGELADSAGLRVLAVAGQHSGARLEAAVDESLHRKAIFVACRDDRPS